MRRFLSHQWQGGQVALTPHHSVQTDGTSYLTAPDTGNRFVFPPIGSGNTTTVALWLQIHSKVGFQRIFQFGDSASAATLVAGLQYNSTNDTLEAFASNGAVFTDLDTGFHPAVDTWYFLGIGFADGAIGMTSWDLTHQIEAISVGLVMPGYNPVASPRMGVFAGPDGGVQLGGGKVDSLAVWPNTAIPGLTPVWNNGQALEYGQLPAAFKDPTKLKLYADFNEPSGAVSYFDATGIGNLMPTGGGLTRQAGAGF